MNKETPNEWKFISADKYCAEVTDGTHDSPKPVEYNGHYLLTSKNITSGILNYENAYCISEEDFNAVNKRSKVNQYDILYSMIGTVGESCIVNQEKINFAIKNVGLFRLNGDLLKAKWLNYFFKSHIAKAYVEKSLKGATQKYIALGILRKFPILVPPTIAEQQEIVQVLDTMSNIIRLREECISHAKELIPSLFIEMFGNPIKNDKKHEQIAIKNLGKVTTGATPPSTKENMFGGTIPFVTPGDLETGNYKYNRYLTEDGSKNSRLVRAGSTMVCCIGATIGKVDKAIVSSCFNQQINAVEWNKEIINDIYALYLFRLLAPLIKAKASNTTLPILNKGNFENILIPKPNMKLQEQFAQKVLEIESYIQEQQEELENAKQMFQSLLHHAFTGELTRRAYGN